MVDIRSQTGKVRHEKARILSPDYSPDSRILMYDYAIIEIEPSLDEVEMTKISSTQRPACQPQYGQTLADSFRTAGWGKTGELFLIAAKK